MASTSKEVARTVLHRLGILQSIQRLIGKKKPYLAFDRLEDRFSNIYETGVWQLGNSSVPLSGEGSSVEATENLRAQLPAALQKIGAGTLLDIGCGDFTWMSQVDLGTIKYIGAEIVPSVVRSNQAKYASPYRSFISANAVAERLPAADAVLCREVLFHLSFNDAKSLLRNALSTGATHFLLTTDTATKLNSDIRSGDFRVLNLCASPFKLIQPSQSIAEDASLPGRRLGIWTANEIAEAINY